MELIWQKNVFQAHGVLLTGEVQFRKKLTRQQFIAFMTQQAPCMVIFEACGGAHYRTREMEALGHEVELIAPQNHGVANVEENGEKDHIFRELRTFKRDHRLLSTDRRLTASPSDQLVTCQTLLQILGTLRCRQEGAPTPSTEPNIAFRIR